MSWEFWPQYLMILLYAFNFGVRLSKVSEKNGVGELLSTMFGIFLSSFILYSGGFFG